MVVFCALAVLQASAAASNVEAFRRATLARDYAWFGRTLAPDYVQTLGTSKIGRAAALAKLRKGLSRSPVDRLSARVVTARLAGKDLLVTVAFAGAMKGSYQGRPTVLDATWRDDQRWVRSQGRWLLRSTRTYRFERTASVR